MSRDYADAVATDPGARVWLVYFQSYRWGPFRTTTGEMRSALEGFRLEKEVEVLRARAQLFRRGPDQSSPDSVPGRPGRRVPRL